MSATDWAGFALLLCVVALAMFIDDHPNGLRARLRRRRAGPRAVLPDDVLGEYPDEDDES